MRRAIAAAFIGALVLQPSASADPKEPLPDVLLSESFDDARLVERKWYDGDVFTIADESPWGGVGCLEFAWKTNATKPFNSSGCRHEVEPSGAVYLRFHLRLSKGFGWTGRAYHPHLVQFLTTENSRWHGPASSHLTVYVEPWNGRLRLATQDAQNKDAAHGLTQGELKAGFNGRFFDSKDELFVDDAWHCVEAMFQLNTLDLVADKPNADGVVRGWFDGKLVVERTDVVLRSTDFPAMKFSQVLLLPYFGPGLLPHAQTLWVDELAVGTKRLESAKQRTR